MELIIPLPPVTFNTYQERRREWPCEALATIYFLEMVLIPSRMNPG